MHYIYFFIRYIIIIITSLSYNKNNYIYLMKSALLLNIIKGSIYRNKKINIIILLIIENNIK